MISEEQGFLPYGPEYDEVLYFFDKDDGYSRTFYFDQRFLLRCTYYRRFWVTCVYFACCDCVCRP